MLTRLPGERYLIVNADDFGLSRGVNQGILAAHERGIVTSTSVMVRRPAADEATAVAHDHPDLSLGLHVDLGDWVYRDGAWTSVHPVLSEPDLQSPAAVADEVSRQLDAFRRLVGRGPTHLDSHQHVHRSDPLRPILASASNALGVPLRHFDSRVRYRGDFYGQLAKGEPHPQGVTAEALCRFLSEVAEGVTELGCHPGLGEDHESPYRAERAAEVASLCDPRVRSTIAATGIRLVSFHALAPERRAP